MTWFKNLKVGKKLISAFVLVLVLALALGVFAIMEMTSINNHYATAMDEASLQVREVVDTLGEYSSARMALREIFYPNTTSSDLQARKNTAVTQFNELEQGFRDLSALTKSEEVQEKIREATPLIERYSAEMILIIDSLLAHDVVSIDNAEYVVALHEAQERIDRAGVSYGNRMSELINEIPDLILAEMVKTADIQQASARSAITLTIIILAVMAGFIILVAIVVPKTITAPLAPLTAFMDKAGNTGDIILSQEDLNTINHYSQYQDETGQCIKGAASFVRRITQVSDVLGKIAEGDLTVDINLLSNADIMGKSVTKMVDNMNTMFGEINSSSTQVDTGAKQIADGAQALSQGSTEQAASVEELSSSIAEIASQTHGNAELAEKAHSLSESIRGNAEKGERQMDEMMSAVRDINAASQNISKVIKVIDDIAFQTNILALNAAVEAARAGQHGKGFAVVAEEVRNLAAKSAEAAKETGDMIQNSMEKAELGSRIASETAVSFTEISNGIQESSNLVEEIARSSKEQATAISQVNIGIDQVAQVVQQNSATAEESAAASQEMSGQSAMLQELISQFRLK
jgi:methyl-accepting chemotaxis protein